MTTVDRPIRFHDESLIMSSNRCIEACVGGEVVIMDLDQGFCFGLDVTGSFVWEQLKAPISVSVLVQHCHERFDAAGGQIESDIAELLAQLLDRQLIILTNPVK